MRLILAALYPKGGAFCMALLVLYDLGPNFYIPVMLIVHGFTLEWNVDGFKMV